MTHPPPGPPTPPRPTGPRVHADSLDAAGLLLATVALVARRKVFVLDGLHNAEAAGMAAARMRFERGLRLVRESLAEAAALSPARQDPAGSAVDPVGVGRPGGPVQPPSDSDGGRAGGGGPTAPGAVGDFSLPRPPRFSMRERENRLVGSVEFATGTAFLGGHLT